MALDYLHVNDLATATLDDTDQIIVGEGNTFKKAPVASLKDSIIGSDAEYTEDTVPYLSARKTKNSGIVGKVAMEQIVGGSLGWNQLCNGSSVTVTSGHKYYMKKSGTESIGSSTGAAITGLTSGTDMVIDLTLALGSTIADYIYSLETATAGAGIAKLKSWGIDLDTYHAYDAGSIQSVEATAHVTTTGKNYLNQSDITVSATTWLNKDIFLPVGTYTFSMDSSNTSGQCTLEILNSSGTAIYNSASSGGSLSLANPVRTFTITEVGAKIRSYINVSSSLSNIQIEKGSSRTAYEPYTAHTYPLGSDTLRGIPQLVNSELQYDGDVKTPDGTISRKYYQIDPSAWAHYASSNGFKAYRITGMPVGSALAQAGTRAISNAVNKFGGFSSANMTERIMQISGGANHDILYLALEDGVDPTTVGLVYELATPTTENGTAYQRIQTVDANGTESFTTSTPVPVGHVTLIPENVLGALQTLVG